MKANVFLGVTLAGLLGWGAAAHAQAYRWVDGKGRVHYSNIRPSSPAPREAPAPASPSKPETVKSPETVKDAEPMTSPQAAQTRPDQPPPIEEILKATGTKKQERTGGGAMTVGFLILSIILVLIGNIWLIVVGFKQSVPWGLLMLFFSPSQALFIFKYWQEAKRPFLVELAGCALAIVGLLMVLARAAPG